MKILQILKHTNLGGITTYVYTLAKYLRRHNIEAAIASSGGSWDDKFQQIGVKTFKLPANTKCEISPKVLISINKLYKIKKEFDFDIIHSHTRVTQVIAQGFSNLSKIPHVANFHGFYTKNKKRRGRKLIKAQGMRSIAITPDVKKDLIELFGANPDKVKVILSAIDLEHFKQPIPLELAGSPKIGSAGRLSSVKGFKYLIESIPEVIKDYPDAHFYLLGEGPQNNELKKLADELRVSEKISFLKQKDLGAFLSSLDIFCYPSLEEPLGLSVLEAQYFRLPCIVSDIGGLKILVDDLKTGIRVPPADSQAIASAIKKLVSDKALTKTISENSHKQVIEKFDFADKVQKYIELYQEVLNENTGS